MKKIAVVYGPPGAGKGTQANLLEDLAGFIHFDTGKYIEQVIRDPKNQNNPAIATEKKKFDSGVLCSPEWVLKIVREEMLELSKTGFNIAFSGSPRTEFEAFGDKDNEGLISVFEKTYGKENVYIFLLNISPESSIKRNSDRLVCSICARPVLALVKIDSCPVCGASFRKRSLDNPETIKVRLEEYKNRTYPIIEKLKTMEFKINEIDGEPLPYKVFEEIKKLLAI